MIRTDIIGICKIAFDREKSVVSALKLIKELLEPEAEGLRKVLEGEYSKSWTSPIRHIEGTPVSENEIQISKEVDALDSKERAEEFGRLLKEIAEEREWLKAHEQTFKNLRNKSIAHLEVKGGEEGPYEIVVPDGPSWTAVKEALRRLIRIAEILLSVVAQEDQSFGQVHEISAKDAQAFWSR